MAKTLDLLGDARHLDCRGQAVRPQANDELFHGVAVLADQFAFAAALFGVAKHIEGGATQTFEPCQQTKGAAYPGAVAAFDELAALVLARQQRWGQVMNDAVIALEQAFDFLHKAWVGVQARHLVFVLVGHELEQVTGHRLGQFGAGRNRLFGLPHPLDQGAVALRIGAVLVGGEELDATLHHIVQALAPGRQADDLRRREQALHTGAVVRRTPTPGEGGLVLIDRHRIEFHGAHERAQRQRNPALLPGKAQEHGVGIEAVAHQAHGRRIDVKGGQGRRAHRLGDLCLTGAARAAPAAVLDKAGGRRGVSVERDVSATGTHAQQRFLVRTDDGVASQHQVSRRGGHPGGAQVLRVLGNQHMAPGAAAFLRQASGVLRDDALAFQVRGHAQQLADGDHAGAPHARDHQAPDRVGAAGERQRLRLGQHAQAGIVIGVGPRLAPLPAQLPALDGHKTRAKALETAHVLVAAALIDLPLAAELGLQRFDRQAVGLHAAVAAALADQLIDDHPPVWIDHGAALAAAAFFGGTGLVVDDDGAARDLAQLALDVIEPIAVLDRHTGGQAHALVLARLVGHHHHLPGTFGQHRLHDLRHGMAFGALAHRLPTGHGHRIVVEDLVGDVHARRDRLSNRQQAAVKVGAVADVGKHMGLVDKRGLPHPGHALATHLREADGGAVHPQGHVVTADAGHGARALGHPGGGVVWAARTEPGRALGRCAQVERLQRTLLGVEHRQVGVDARAGVGVQPQALEPAGDGTRDDGRAEVGIGAQQGVGAGVGHRPLAAAVVAADLVELAQHVGPHIGAPVVELFLELIFDDLALFFDHQNLAQAGGKFAGGLRLERPDHAHLVQPHPQAPAGGVVQAQVDQGLAGVVVGLAAGHDAQTVRRALDHVVVEPVGANVGQGRIPLVVKQPRLLLQGRVGPADVHTAGRHLEFGQHDLHPVGVDAHTGRGLDDFLDRLHARPDAGITAHGDGMQTEVEDLLHAGRKKHRQPAGLEDVVALMGGGRTLGNVVVAGHRQHAAPGRGAGHVGMLEHIGAAVHARPLAVPDAKHPVVASRVSRRKTELLRAPDGGGGQLLIDAGLEVDVMLAQVILGLPQRLVVAAQGRAAVTADEAAGVLALAQIALALQHGQANQRLHAAHEGQPSLEGVFVVQRDGIERAQEVLGQWGIHGWVS